MCHPTGYDLLENPNATKEEDYGMDAAQLGLAGISCYTRSSTFLILLERGA